MEQWAVPLIIMMIFQILTHSYLISHSSLLGQIYDKALKCFQILCYWRGQVLERIEAKLSTRQGICM